ncbi:hypothetical protein [Oleiagrimonas sp. MCCC 1A03011]|uniref:hypothetical protein n=1 Tax=Oleiagrimonas sp. MCCC 1A03011 TaxID=1926883 RepID=UPI000DC208A3|nr:hypothetical protein [Oleiagrimonas sp. MCCC 1A03011]RAP59189.1 hypothetical protein BTJ49_00400 [Oleiagrimonas sp. MCCC 1A03011]
MHARHARFLSAHRAMFLLRWAALLLLLAPVLGMAQGVSQRLSASDRAEISNFQLNQDVLARLQAVTADGKAMHVKKSQLDMSKVHSLDDMADQLVSVDPRIKPLLSKHGFTPHQFVVANLALVGTAMAVRMERDPKMAKYIDTSKLNQHNVQFYKSHEAQILRMMQQSQGDQ